MALFKFRAVCPVCGTSLPPPSFDFAPDHWPSPMTCRHCLATIRPNSRPYHRLIVVLICAIIAIFFLFHFRSDDIAADIVFVGVLLFTFGWYRLTPYCTSFTLVARGPMCPACRYDLYGSVSDTCAECGAGMRAVREEGRRLGDGEEG